ncbi:cytochrome c3 family protein [Ramlibacter sp. RBP-2]|uniref:Cytochrome c3 family protein n=1 Tax=Ramlibacter lithotrophicus TaxID=2606681 RepID=A0A7X6DGP6_9BURK|nr:cytochrome c3 family protein [Ramlibacter lithotrophicus]NKE66832.1 cytochrome c3 family protein [Ramlibacter lithotrophicus]
MSSLRKHLSWAWRIAAALFFASTAPAAMAAVTTVTPGSIVGTKHDFVANSTYTGTNNSKNQICIYCHAPHNNYNAAGTLLWNRAYAGAAAYTLYTSGTMNATAPQPNTVSKVCLSCHDGTTAIDAFGGAAGNAATIFAAGAKANLATDLSNDHPISILYTAGTADPDLHLTSNTATIGATAGRPISDLLYGSGATATVECSSCHDVHNSTRNTAETDKLLKITSSGSAICLACHKK